ncbi:unnamed protein product [Rhizopus stolonifer]
MNFPTRASAKFQAIHRKIKALRDTKSASISLEKYRELGSDDEEQEEDDKEQEEDADEQVMNNEQESDKKESDKKRE